MRSFSDSATRCSKFEYACTTYQRNAMLNPPCPVSVFVAHASSRSSSQKNAPNAITNTNTTTVVRPVSWRFGQTILRSSMRASSTNWRNAAP